MNDSKHTPKTWEANGTEVIRNTRVILRAPYIGGDFRDAARAEKVVKLAVRAVNSYEAMRSIGAKILEAHDTNNNGAVTGEAKLCAAFARELRAALALADGQD